MPKCEETFSIICNTFTAGVGLGFVGLASFILQKHYVHGVVVSPAISEAFAALSFGCLLILSEIVINSAWCRVRALGTDFREATAYQALFIAAAVWKFALMIMELAVGLALFTPVTMDAKINETMSGAFGGYAQGPPVTESVDNFQHDLQCCGVADYKYWFTALEGNDVTPGCCRNLTLKDCYKDIKGAVITTIEEKIYMVGCFETYEDSLAEASVFAIFLFYASVAILVLSSISYIVNVIKNRPAGQEIKNWEDAVDNAYTFDLDKKLEPANETGTVSERTPMNIT